MVLRIPDLVPACDTSAQGETIRALILSELAQGKRVALDFHGVTNVTSSFANAALVPLLDEFSFDDIRQRLQILNANRQVADMIRQRMVFESQRTSRAAA